MLSRWFSPKAKTHPLPQSLYQSLESPIQPDRLPDTSQIELEYPTQRFSAAEDRRHSFFLLAAAALAGVLLGLVEMFLAWWATAVEALVATAAMYVFFAIALRRKSLWRRAIILSLVLPVIVATIFILREPYLILAVAMAAALMVADRFAAHYFYLRTAVPMAQKRALSLRAVATPLPAFRPQRKGS